MEVGLRGGAGPGYFLEELESAITTRVELTTTQHQLPKQSAKATRSSKCQQPISLERCLRLRKALERSQRFGSGRIWKAPAGPEGTRSERIGYLQALEGSRKLHNAMEGSVMLKKVELWRDLDGSIKLYKVPESPRWLSSNVFGSARFLKVQKVWL